MWCQFSISSQSIPQAIHLQDTRAVLVQFWMFQSESRWTHCFGLWMETEYMVALAAYHVAGSKEREVAGSCGPNGVSAFHWASSSSRHLTKALALTSGFWETCVPK